MCPMTLQPEDHSGRTDPACDALSNHAPRALKTLYEFLDQSLPLLPLGVSLPSHSQVLDVGCGDHLWGRHLLDHMLVDAHPDSLTDLSIEGIERCPERVQAARQAIPAGQSQIVVTHGDLLHLPASYENSFQFVQMRFLLLSLGASDWPKALAELWRVCAPGGIVAWLEPSLPTPYENAPGWNQWVCWIAQAITAHGGSPSIDRSMTAFFARTGAWETPRSEVIPLPLLRDSQGQGLFPAERLLAVRSWLEEISPWLVEGGIPHEQVDAGRTTVLEEINRQVIRSRWRWNLAMGTKPQEH